MTLGPPDLALTGAHVSLVPLDAAHHDALAAASEAG